MLWRLGRWLLAPLLAAHLLGRLALLVRRLLLGLGLPTLLLIALLLGLLPPLLAAHLLGLLTLLLRLLLGIGRRLLGALSTARLWRSWLLALSLLWLSLLFSPPLRLTLFTLSVVLSSASVWVVVVHDGNGWWMSDVKAGRSR